MASYFEDAAGFKFLSALYWPPSLLLARESRTSLYSRMCSDIIGAIFSNRDLNKKGERPSSL